MTPSTFIIAVFFIAALIVCWIGYQRIQYHLNIDQKVKEIERREHARYQRLNRREREKHRRKTRKKA